MIRAVAIRFLRQVLLVIVGPMNGNPMGAKALCRLAPPIGRLSVDLVDMTTVDE
jgi:hypothetical protein